jgi:retron-type reverse transcriptase
MTGKGKEESYEPIVPEKVGDRRPRDPLEGRGEQADVSAAGDMMTHRSQKNMSTALSRISDLAREDRQQQFISIAHHLTPSFLYAAFRSLRRQASAGVDGVTYAEYEENAEVRVQQLHERLKSKRYRAQPLRRTYIPKESGEERPISIPVLEDKIVQKAVVRLLNAIYEQDFLDCSYGFREGRSAHSALDEVGRVICRRPISWVLDADIRGYFDSIVRGQLMELVEGRVRDGSILRLIRKWIKVGVIESGRLLVTKTGTGQGQVHTR